MCICYLWNYWFSCFCLWYMLLMSHNSQMFMSCTMTCCLVFVLDNNCCLFSCLDYVTLFISIIAVQWLGRSWTDINTREIPSSDKWMEPKYWTSWGWLRKWRPGAKVFYDSCNRCLPPCCCIRRNTYCSAHFDKLWVTNKEGAIYLPETYLLLIFLNKDILHAFLMQISFCIILIKKKERKV